MGFYEDMHILQHKEELEKIEAGRWDECIPIHVRIELTEVCNLRCSFCWWHNDKKRKTLNSFNFNGKQIFNHDRMRDLIDELADIGVKACSFTGAGDPLMYPYITDILDKMLDRGLLYGVTSNMAMHMSNDLIGLLLKAGWLRWSMNAGTEGTYAAIHNPHGKDSNKIFLRAQENVRRINQQRKENENRPDFNASYVVSDCNQEDIITAAHMARDFGMDSISFRPDTPIKRDVKPNAYSEHVIQDIRKAQESIQTERFSVYMNEIRQEDIQKSGDPDLICFYSNHTTYIDAHGDIYPCCYTRFHSDYVMGNIMNQDFRTFWFSADRKEFYKQLFQDACPACSYGGINKALKHLYTGKVKATDFLIQKNDKNYFV